MRKFETFDGVLCVPSNPCLNEACERHVAAWEKKDLLFSMADLSLHCKDYQPLVPVQLDLFNAYDFCSQ